ncbi:MULTISPECIES: ribonuclease inhibitor [unclassified Kitasatospora]|uniref:ribonuclease inhibitor n=1 Tax=unclassified Kitasatospora TaxID=2633591 RepID=UPI000AF2C561|nr:MULTISPECIES: ribonuclease inhibitor [unclassified Kitasatospora]
MSTRPDLAPLLAWLRAGDPATERIDFPTGTALPDGRLDLCKQDLGPDGAALVAESLPPRGPVHHLLLGTDRLGDQGAAAVTARALATEVKTLYLGCNNITTTGACRIADHLRASPQTVQALWLKRNPLGGAAADLVRSAEQLRTLDLVQTGLTPAALTALVDAVVTSGRPPFQRLYLGGNPLGPDGARQLARLVEAGATAELYISAAGLGDSGAAVLARALGAAPYGRLRRLSLASSGLGPSGSAELVVAAAAAGVELLDLGRVKAAGILGAPDNRLDAESARTIGAALSGTQHRLRHLVLANTGLRSREAHLLLDAARHAATPTRYVIGKGVATTVRRRLDELAATVPPPAVPADVAAVLSVHRTAGPS